MVHVAISREETQELGHLCACDGPVRWRWHLVREGELVALLYAGGCDLPAIGVEHVVVLGDFNDTPDEASWRREVRGLLAVGLAFLAWWFKSRLEEKFMEQQFGEEYAVYKRRVKALIPFVL